MKLAKRLFALALVLCMVFCLSAAVFAADGDEPYDGKLDKPAVVSKTYEIGYGESPTENFAFSFRGISYKNGDGETVANATIPTIGDQVVQFGRLTETTTNTTDLSINANNYEIGVYTYEVTEIVPTTKTAGVTYSNEKLYLVLTILRDETNGKHYVAAMHYENASGDDKSTGFTNKYEAGSLEVSKVIQGNMANMNKKFTFTITLTEPAGTEINSEITSNSTAGTWEGQTYTIALGNGESVKLDNIPAGTTYTVTEDEENYTSNGGVFSNGAKTITNGTNDTAVFTNTLTSEVDTGISLDSLPYILALAAACAGAVVMFTRKRRVED